MNINTNEKMYIIAKVEEFFYIIADVIIWIESPSIRETNVVTDFAKELKNETLGNRHMPRNVYARNTGKNYTKKNPTLSILNLISSYINDSFFSFLINLNTVIHAVKHAKPTNISFSIPINK